MSNYSKRTTIAAIQNIASQSQAVVIKEGVFISRLNDEFALVRISGSGTTRRASMLRGAVFAPGDAILIAFPKSRTVPVIIGGYAGVQSVSGASEVAFNADIVGYDPIDLTDWGGSDPGNVNDALDQLADTTYNIRNWTHTFDFSIYHYNFVAREGTWTESSGFSHRDMPEEMDGFFRRCAVRKRLGFPTTITQVSITYDFTRGSYFDGTRHSFQLYDIPDVNIWHFIEMADHTTGTDKVVTVDGPWTDVSAFQISIESSQSLTEAYSGSVLIKSITVSGQGPDPFGGGGSPVNLKYWTGESLDVGDLGHDYTLGDLATGLVKNTAGVPSIATDGTDYVSPTALLTPPPIGTTTPNVGKFSVLGLTSASILTISTGSVTATQSAHIIAAETGTADELVTITAATNQNILFIQADAGDTITIKNGTGNIFLNGGADYDISGDKTLALWFDGTNWSDIGIGSGGGAPDDASYVTISSEAGLSNETTLATALASPPAIGGTASAAGKFTKLGFASATILTLSSDAVTATQSFHLIAAETGTTDNLATITAASDQNLVVIQADTGDTITVKHGTGNILLNGTTDYALSGDKTVILFYDGTNWSDVGIGAVGSGFTSFTLAGDSGSSQTISDGNTATIAGGTGISTVAGATDTVTVNLDISELTVETANDNDDLIAIYDDSAAAIRKQTRGNFLGGSADGVVIPSVTEGRLSLTTNVPITTSDVTAAGTLYFTPITGQGNKVALYDGSAAWYYKALTECNLSLSGLLAHYLYDIFVYDNSGTWTLEAVAWTAPPGATDITNATNATPIVITTTGAHGLTTGQLVTISGVGGNTAANGTFRVGTTAANTFQLKTLADGNTTGSGAYTSGGKWTRADYTSYSRATALETQDSVYVKNGATAHKYVGTIKIGNEDGQTEDSLLNRLVCNWYNATPRKIKSIESTNSWTYGTNSYDALNGTLANRINFVSLHSSPIECLHQALIFTNTSTIWGGPGIALDSITTNDADTHASGLPGLTNRATMFANYSGLPSIGAHFLQLLQLAQGGTVTFYGDSGVNYIQTGAIGTVWA